MTRRRNQDIGKSAFRHESRQAAPERSEPKFLVWSLLPAGLSIVAAIASYGFPNWGGKEFAKVALLALQPWAYTLAILGALVFRPLFLVALLLLVVQYPLYGFALRRGYERGNVRARWLWVTVPHAIVASVFVGLHVWMAF